MIKGIGIDMVEIDRIKQSIKRQPRFVQRILTENEYQRCLALQEQRQAEFAAGASQPRKPSRRQQVPASAHSVFRIWKSSLQKMGRRL